MNLKEKWWTFFKRSSGGMMDKIKLNYADLLWASFCSLFPGEYENCHKLLKTEGFCAACFLLLITKW